MAMTQKQALAVLAQHGILARADGPENIRAREVFGDGSEEWVNLPANICGPNCKTPEWWNSTIFGWLGY